MKLFHRKKRENLSKSQSVPEGTFRCDVCRFIQPSICLCGAVADASDNPPRVYTLCGVCALWLGLGTSHFPRGLLFNFSEKQRGKIEALHQEIDNSGSFGVISDKITALANDSIEKLRTTDNHDESLEKTPEFLKTVPNLRALIRFRFSLLNNDLIELSGRLTRGEFVDPREIKKANK